MRARCFIERWPLKTPFVISRGVRTEAVVVVVELDDNGIIGVGECTPYARYGETPEQVMAEIDALLPEIESGMDRHRLQLRLAAGAARNALDCALVDLHRQQCGETGAPGPEVLPSVQTLAIDAPQAMARRASELVAAGVETLKLKLDETDVEARVEAVRAAAPGARLVIDANESWGVEGLEERCAMLAHHEVSMLEQPLPADNDHFLETFPHPLPICADESCHTRADLPRLEGRYDMLNIKLDKTGGITEATALAAQGKAKGFRLMLGCMLCTSRAIRAAWTLGENMEFCDLDGPTWLAQDARPSLRFDAGRVYWS